MKIIIFISFNLLATISFADVYIVIGGQPYEEIDNYYVEQIMPQGSLINTGWINIPHVPNNPGEKYFVYGLTNVITGTMYGVPDRIVCIMTNQYAYDYEQNIKCAALVLLPKPEQDRIAARAAQHLKDEARDRQVNLKARQNARMAEVAEKKFYILKVDATNVSASSQYELGNYYLNGLSPAQTNATLGAYWIKKATAKLNNDATNFMNNTN
jgi:hypothetical protein